MFSWTQKCRFAVLAAYRHIPSTQLESWGANNYLACLAPEAILSLLNELPLEFPSCPGVLLIKIINSYSTLCSECADMLFGAVRLNGGSKRSSQSTSLKTLPAFTHDMGWFFGGPKSEKKCPKRVFTKKVPKQGSYTVKSAFSVSSLLSGFRRSLAVQGRLSGRGFQRHFFHFFPGIQENTFSGTFFTFGDLVPGGVCFA
jgi:hypothetical protein